MLDTPALLNSRSSRHGERALRVRAALHRCGQRLGAAADEGDLPAFGDEGLRAGAADAAAGPRDDGGLVGVHAALQQLGDALS
jgi:hypothetical protein